MEQRSCDIAIVYWRGNFSGPGPDMLYCLLLYGYWNQLTVYLMSAIVLVKLCSLTFYLSLSYVCMQRKKKVAVAYTWIRVGGNKKVKEREERDAGGVIPANRDRRAYSTGVTEWTSYRCVSKSSVFCHAWLVPLLGITYLISPFHKYFLQIQYSYVY